MASSLFEKLGGEPNLREIINTFIDRVFEDRRIGFFFRNADRTRIKELEYQLAAGFLGAAVKYQRRPLDQVHAKHSIIGGRFARRSQILKETLAFYHVPEVRMRACQYHSDALRSLLTSQSDATCDPIIAGRE